MTAECTSPPLRARQPNRVAHRRGARWFLAFAFAATAAVLDAAAPADSLSLLADVNTTFVEGELPDERSSNPAPRLALGSRVLIEATTPATGREVWAVDSTGGAAELLVDKVPGQDYLEASIISSAGSIAYFSVQHGVDQLWSTDGTPAGTTQLSGSISQLVYDSTDDVIPQHCRRAGDRFLFTDDRLDPDGFHQLWSSDGTIQGTAPIGETPRRRSTSPYFCIEAINAMWYVPSYPSPALWRTDGTTGGTLKLLDLPVRPRPEVGAWLNGKALYFGADKRLWSTDGTLGGTGPLSDAVLQHGMTQVYSIVVDGETAFFRAHDETHGWEVWKTDGSSAGTERLTSLAMVDPFHNLEPAHRALAIGSDHVVFYAIDDVDGSELWSVPTAGGLAAELSVCVNGDCADGYGLYAATNGVVFLGTSDEFGVQLHRTDGTAAGTQRIGTLTGGSGSVLGQFEEIEDHVYFVRRGDSGDSDQLWRSDGTSGGTSPATAFPSAAFHGEELPLLPRLWAFGRLWFAAEQPEVGLELWTTTGDPESVELREISKTGPSSAPSDYSQVGSRLVLTAIDGALHEWWQTDGTSAGTQRIDVPGEPMGGGLRATRTSIDERAVLGWLNGWNSMLYGADLPSGDVELLVGPDEEPAGGSALLGDRAAFFVWSDSSLELRSSDGTASGTMTLLAAPSDIDVTDVANAGGRFLFLESGALWTTDGTAAGTIPLELQLRQGSSLRQLPSNPPNWFSWIEWQSAESDDWGLGISDGQPSGTRQVASGRLRGHERPFAAVFGQYVYFMAQLSLQRLELRRAPVAGGEIETVAVLLDDFYAEAGEIVATSDQLFFTFYRPRVLDAHLGPELWVSDGTEAGTQPLGLGSPERSAWPSLLLPVADRLYFVATDHVHGLELWSSDGTEAGTAMVADLAPGLVSSRISELFYADCRLYLGADDGVTGIEPWVLDFDVCPGEIFHDGFESGDPYGWSEALMGD